MNISVRPVRHRRVRAGATQLLCVVTGIGLGLSLPRIDGGPRAPARQVTELLFGTAVGLVAAVALVFSLLFLVVQWVATTFTPRLTLFRDAPIVWRTFAFALGLVALCITAALAIGHDDDVSIAVPVAAMLLLLVMLGMLRALQFRAFAAIQLSPALNSIAAPGRAVLLDLSTTDGSGPPAPLPPRQATITWPRPPAVLQRLDEDRLLAAARAANAVVVIRQTPGATLHHGTPVADIHGAPMPAATVLAALRVGNERTFEQDPLLAFRLLTDIALRALSPAINDPATAVQALDELGDLLARVADIPLTPTRFAEPDGTERLLVRLPEWDTFVRTALDDVIATARTSPMVLQHLHQVLEQVRDHARPDRRDPLTHRLSWVDEELADRFPHLPRLTPPPINPRHPTKALELPCAVSRHAALCRSYRASGHAAVAVARRHRKH